MYFSFEVFSVSSEHSREIHFFHVYAAYQLPPNISICFTLLYVQYKNLHYCSTELEVPTNISQCWICVDKIIKLSNSNILLIPMYVWFLICIFMVYTMLHLDKIIKANVQNITLVIVACLLFCRVNVFKFQRNTSRGQMKLKWFIKPINVEPLRWWVKTTHGGFIFSTLG